MSETPTPQPAPADPQPPKLEPAPKEAEQHDDDDRLADILEEAAKLLRLLPPGLRKRLRDRLLGKAAL